MKVTTVSGNDILIDADLWFGVGLAIHESSMDDGTWTISHYHSGRAVLRNIQTKENAYEYMMVLYHILSDWKFGQSFYRGLDFLMLASKVKKVQTEIDEIHNEAQKIKT